MKTMITAMFLLTAAFSVHAFECVQTRKAHTINEDLFRGSHRVSAKYELLRLNGKGEVEVVDTFHTEKSCFQSAIICKEKFSYVKIHEPHSVMMDPKVDVIYKYDLMDVDGHVYWTDRKESECQGAKAAYVQDLIDGKF